MDDQQWLAERFEELSAQGPARGGSFLLEPVGARCPVGGARSLLLGLLQPLLERGQPVLERGFGTLGLARNLLLLARDSIEPAGQRTQIRRGCGGAVGEFGLFLFERSDPGLERLQIRRIRRRVLRKLFHAPP